MNFVQIGELATKLGSLHDRTTAAFDRGDDERAQQLSAKQQEVIDTIDALVQPSGRTWSISGTGRGETLKVNIH